MLPFPSFRGPLGPPARPLQPLCAHPGPQVPARPAPGLPLFCKNGGTTPARSIAPRAHSLRRRKGRRAERCAVDGPTRPRPSRHLTYWHLREVRSPPPTLSPTRQHRRQEASVSQTDVPSREQRWRQNSVGPRAGPLAPHFRGLTEQVRLRAASALLGPDRAVARL